MVVVIFAFASPAGAGLPSSARTLMAHKVSPQRQLALADRTVKHARDVLRFLRVYPMYGTPASRFRVQRDHRWLLRFGLSQQAEARARLRPSPRAYAGPCLAAIIDHEGSGWDPTRWNTQGSGAYGLPQALPGSKMASAGPDWQTNPYTQIRWAHSYAVQRYGSDCLAWAHWQAASSW